MQWRRIIRHLWVPAASAHRHFPVATVDQISELISQSETRHSGEICFAVESALDWGLLVDEISPRDRALQLFGQLRVWDTPENNGVLIYLLIADHDIEIIADRSIDQKVGAAEWARICRSVETRLRRGDFADGVCVGLQEITEQLAQHFPYAGDGDKVNRLPDRPVVL